MIPTLRTVTPAFRTVTPSAPLECATVASTGRTNLGPAGSPPIHRLSRAVVVLALAAVGGLALGFPPSASGMPGGAPLPPCSPVSSTIVDPTLTPVAHFGSAMAADGDVLAVCALLDGGPIAGYPGSVSLWRWSGSSYLFEQKIVGPMPAETSSFGTAVAVGGSVLVVGSEGGDPSLPAGRVYVYRFDGTTWNEEQVLAPSDGATSTRFGGAVAIDGEVIAVGARFDGEAASAAGAVYLFRWSGTEWIEEAKLIASDATTDDTLGNAVALDGDTLIAGAKGAIFVGGFNPGAAYCFQFDGSAWIETQKLTASPPISYDQFGTAVDVDGDTIAITAGYGGNGAAYLFTRVGESWEPQQVLDPGGDVGTGDVLGWHTSVALSGDTVAFGDSEGPFTPTSPHVVFVYRFDGINWSLEEALSAAGAPNDELYGTALALTDDRLAIGVPGRDDLANDAGGVEIVELCRSGFIRGDVNQDSLINIADAVFGLDYLFEPGATSAPCPDSADVNDDGSLNLADPIALLTLLFDPSVNTLPYPYPSCGADPSPDAIAPGLCSEVCP